jgi:hypothetical protein
LEALATPKHFSLAAGEGASLAVSVRGGFCVTFPVPRPASGQLMIFYQDFHRYDLFAWPPGDFSAELSPTFFSIFQSVQVEARTPVVCRLALMRSEISCFSFSAACLFPAWRGCERA